MRQANTVEYRAEARIKADLLPARIELQPNKPMGPLLDSFFQPIEGLILLTQACVNQCNPVCRHIFLSREFLQFFERLGCLRALAGKSRGVADSGQRNRPIAQNDLRLVLLSDCLRIHAHLLIGSAQPKMGEGEARIDG